jgi:hypothetical protein
MAVVSEKGEAMRKYVLVPFVVVMMACASAPVSKDTAIVSLQASNVALSNAADAERALCFVNPQTESGPHCTNPLAAASGLTDARHASATDLLITGFKDQKIADAALTLWQPGQTAPADVLTYQADVTNVLNVAKVLDPKGANFLTQVQSAANDIVAVLTAMGVK